jgi:hypothetical protein
MNFLWKQWDMVILKLSMSRKIFHGVMGTEGGMGLKYRQQREKSSAVSGKNLALEPLISKGSICPPPLTKAAWKNG